MEHDFQRFNDILSIWEFGSDCVRDGRREKSRILGLLLAITALKLGV